LPLLPRLDTLWANPERGVFRTTDGGITWQRVLYKDENTAPLTLHSIRTIPTFCSLLSGKPVAPVEPDQRRRRQRSLLLQRRWFDWKQLQEHGLPKPPYGRIGVAFAAGSDRMYALIEAGEGGLYRSDDGGENWQLVNDSRAFQQRAWYYMHVVADPNDPDTVYILNVDFYKSTDGGRSFNKLKVPHGDNHGLWIDPTNSAA